jgi:hypothetical protein
MCFPTGEASSVEFRHPFPGFAEPQFRLGVHEPPSRLRRYADYSNAHGRKCQALQFFLDSYPPARSDRAIQRPKGWDASGVSRTPEARIPKRISDGDPAKTIKRIKILSDCLIEGEGLVSATKDKSNVVLEKVTSRIDEALIWNSRLEWVLICMLVILFVTGLALIAYGTVSASWVYTVPGGLAELSIILPINRLNQLREFNLILQTIPSLTSLADSSKAKAEVVRLIRRLAQKV